MQTAAESQQNSFRHGHENNIKVYNTAFRRTALEVREQLMQQLCQMEQRGGLKAQSSDSKGQANYLSTLEQSQDPRPSKAVVTQQRSMLLQLPTSLPPVDDKAVDRILCKKGLIAKVANEQVFRKDIDYLMPGRWLNDEIVNLYGAMILARSQSSEVNQRAGAQSQVSEKGVFLPLNIHYFGSFLWRKMEKEGYDKGRLAAWTKKVDIFSKDIILIPVHHDPDHWSAAAINFRRKRFESYDSMGMEAAEHIFKLVRDYIGKEHFNKKNTPFDFTCWENWAPADTPQQTNGHDCGVFTCQVLEALSRGEETFSFRQGDMPYLRRRMIWEIGNATLRGSNYS